MKWKNVGTTALTIGGVRIEPGDTFTADLETGHALSLIRSRSIAAASKPRKRKGGK